MPGHDDDGSTRCGSGPARMLIMDEVLRAAIVASGVALDEFMSQARSFGRSGFSTREGNPNLGSRLLPGGIAIRLPPLFCSMADVAAQGDLPEATFFTARYLELSADVAYRTRYGLREQGVLTDVPSHLMVSGTRLPDTVLTAMGGGHPSMLVRHPALMHPDLTIIDVGNGEQGLKVNLEEMLVEVDAEGREKTRYRRPDDPAAKSS